MNGRCQSSFAFGKENSRRRSLVETLTEVSLEMFANELLEMLIVKCGGIRGEIYGRGEITKEIARNVVKKIPIVESVGIIYDKLR